MNNDILACGGYHKLLQITSGGRRRPIRTLWLFLVDIKCFVMFVLKSITKTKIHVRYVVVQLIYFKEFILNIFPPYI